MRENLQCLALAVAVAGSGARAAAVPTATASRTVTYACGMSGLWACPSVRPGEIAFGARYDVARMSWSRWAADRANGRGHYYGFGSYHADITLYNVKRHHGRRYFSWIKIAARCHRARYLQYSGGIWRTR